MSHYLSLLIFVPVLMAAVVWMVPERLVRLTTLIVSIAHFFYSLLLFFYFDPSSAGLQLVEKQPWIGSLGINYFIGIDGISFWLVLLTTFLAPIVVLASWSSIDTSVKGFHSALLTLTAAMVGSFLAMDSILFYIFFEASLIPMYFMIGLWGGSRRLYATMKFFVYTMVGSLFMLVGILVLIQLTGEQQGTMSASVLDFYKLRIPFVGGEFLSTQTLLLLAFSLGFAIKVPMFPFHTWLPDAHVEAPTPGSVLLAAVMLKMGTYGFLRFVIPLFPDAVEYWAPMFMFLAVIGIIYGALVAMVQTDIKKLVAYSSVSHMGYVVLGLFALNYMGLEGGLYQMLNHGVSTGALFLLVGMVYERTHSREISGYGGLAKVAPWFSIAFIIITMSSIAVPMTNGFVGEFLILLGAFDANWSLALFAVSGVVLGATYMLWMVKRVFFGEAGSLVQKYSGTLEINAREALVLSPFIVLVFAMGLAPNGFLKYSRASLHHLAKNKSNYELSVVGQLSRSDSALKVVERGQ